jgi:uncharacterized membrane protein YbhN (UPF0104 family)
MLLQLSVLGLAFLPLDLGDGSISPLLTAVATGSTGVVAMVLLLAPGLFVASIERFVGMLPPSFRAPLGAAQRIAIQIMGPAGDRLAVAAAVLYSLPFYAAVILAQYFMLHAVGAHVGLFEVVLGAPLVCAVTLLPVTVNGLFLAEGAFVLVYASVGVAPETALAAAILRRLVDLANSGFGGLLWLAWQTDPDEPQGSLIGPERQGGRAPHALRGHAATRLRYQIGGRVL